MSFSFSHLSRRHHIISLTFESCWKHTILIIKCMTAATITTEHFKFTVIKTCISMRVFHVDRLMQCVRFSFDIFSCFSHLRSFFSVLLYLMLCKFFSSFVVKAKRVLRWFLQNYRSIHAVTVSRNSLRYMFAFSYIYLHLLVLSFCCPNFFRIWYHVKRKKKNVGSD